MNPITYGASVTATELVRFLDHVTAVNLQAEAAGRRKFPVCIWGRHGIGKTEIVRDFARERGFPFVYIAPAQFEEMGDLLGMPQVTEFEGRTVTSFRPPAWAPTHDGPGILLLDDVNRADDRILRGLMQLLLDFRLVSWALPPRWQIVLTANPEGGDYSVTPIDDALVTRLRHVTLTFDAKAWARWAVANGVDSRGIQFVLSHPDTVTGRRTTPRTLVQFFETVARIENLSSELTLVQTLAEASLDAETTAAFLTFVRQGWDRLISPAALVDAVDFERQVREPLQRQVCGAVLRVDILAALCTRLAHHLEQRHISPKSRQSVNLAAFFRLDFLPADLRFALAQDLAAIDRADIREFLADPELGALLL